MSRKCWGERLILFNCLTYAPFLSRMRDVFYSDLILGVLGCTSENNIRMSLYATGQEGMDRVWLNEVL